MSTSSSGFNPLDLIDKRAELFALGLILIGSMLIGQITGMLNITMWLELTLAGLSMGLIMFLMSSGFTLVFGLMGIFNLAHGAFIALGAYLGFQMIWIIDVGTRVVETKPQVVKIGKKVIPIMKDGVPVMKTIILEQGWFYSEGWASSLGAFILGILFAALVAGFAGFLFERVVVKPVYDNPLKQILVTMGGGIIIRELLIAGWEMPFEFPKPPFLAGMNFTTFGGIFSSDVSIETFRIFGGVIGLVVFIAMVIALNYTKIGLLIRAGVESKEMVEVHGYRIKLLFILVFAVAIILAACGGVFWSQYAQMVDFDMGNTLLILVVVSIIVGGMGSVYGCFIGSILITLMMNYTNSMLSVIGGEMSAVLLMVAILMWRPQGLKPITAH